MVSYNATRCMNIIDWVLTFVPQIVNDYEQKSILGGVLEKSIWLMTATIITEIVVIIIIFKRYRNKSATQKTRNDSDFGLHFQTHGPCRSAFRHRGKSRIWHIGPKQGNLFDDKQHMTLEGKICKLFIVD